MEQGGATGFSLRLGSPQNCAILFGGFEVQPMERHENTARKKEVFGNQTAKGTGQIPGLVENTDTRK